MKQKQNKNKNDFFERGSPRGSGAHQPTKGLLLPSARQLSELSGQVGEIMSL
jgi:hypothetical protein